ncbi:HamA C-terminal domain-containing protein [Arthrobacter glacialis]|uniref:DUF1837 domain-containing protein n=1 Tax=Arthrobacter glacialis TaxID=1664 RepID=A0A2S4A0F1_ARTGL|nr:DUF1837 domain-containing protein [Arthrobacter glacialis]POH74672.1 DUF1837 domain-containing protein [Arthrobacter glacialis]
MKDGEMSDDTPGSVLNVVVHNVEDKISLLGVCAGHEDKKWRYDALSRDLMEWAADWVLTYEEKSSFTSSNAMSLISKTLSRIYTSAKKDSRGEIGELLLHIILRKHLNSEQAITRIYFKDAPNMTVNGFDAVHIVERKVVDENESDLELWLGESKFYVDSYDAVRAVIAELNDHLDTDYLRTEFAAISDKVSPAWSHSTQIKALLAREVSLDAVFASVVIPVFITFDSEITAGHDISSSDYIAEIRDNLESEWSKFKIKLEGQTLPREVRICLILLPMATKRELVSAFDERLKAWQLASKF